MNKEFNDFSSFMKKGLEKGTKEYGKYSFLKKDDENLLIDIQEECRDIANYAFMLWMKIEMLKKVNVNVKRIFSLAKRYV